MKPSVNSKVGAGAFAGALSVILVWLLSFLLGPNAIPPEIASAFTTVLTFATSWFVPNLMVDKAQPQLENMLAASSAIPTVPRPTQAALN